MFEDASKKLDISLIRGQRSRDLCVDKYTKGNDIKIVVKDEELKGRWKDFQW